jgi:hypothetical protein
MAEMLLDPAAGLPNGEVVTANGPGARAAGINKRV